MKNNNTYILQKNPYGASVWKKKAHQHEESLELRLIEYGCDNCPSNYDWGPGRKESHTLHYVTSGKGILMLNDQYYSLSAGDVFYISPTDLAYYRADSDDPWVYQWIQYDGTKSSILMGASILPKEHVIHHDKEQYIKKFFRKIEKCANDPQINNFELTGYLYSFFGRLIRWYPRTWDSHDSIPFAYIDVAVDYLKSNYHNKNVISDLSNHLNLDRTYIYRLFKTHLSCSPLEFLEQLRIDKACELLKQKDISTHDISLSVGFQAYSSFYRSFLKKIGMTPTQYRNEKS